MTLAYGVSRVIPPLAFGDLDIDPRNGMLSGTGVQRLLCSNHGGKLQSPSVILLHFTTSVSSARLVIDQLELDGKSVHLVIDRGGELCQAVSFNYVAKHAGAGSWGGFQNNLNENAIGIELNNLGPLWMTEDYRFIDSYGVEHKRGDLIPLPHRNAAELDLKQLAATEKPPPVAYDAIIKKGIDPKKLNLFCYWEPYPDAQQRALQRLCSLLLTRFPSIRAIIGHDEYAPRRKFDPGPALPMDKLVGWMPGARIVLPPDDPSRPHYLEDRGEPDFMRNLVSSRTFAGGVVRRDVG